MRKWYDELAQPYTQIGDVRDLCKKHNIELHSVPTINCKETVQLFKKANPDLGVSLGNGYIGSKVFNTPKMGMINIHHEQLPEYQNAQSIIWQLYNNSDKTGYTIHKIDKHIDTGDILYQEEVPIKFNDTLALTVAETSSLLLKASAKGLAYVLSNLNKVFSEAYRQGKGNKYTTPNYRQFLRIKHNFKKLKKAKAL